MHATRACDVSNCKRWHYTNSSDDSTKGKVVSFYKERAKGKGEEAEVRVNYKSKQFQYYPNGKLCRETIEKGWSNGWSGTIQGITKWYDGNGKCIRKEIRNGSTILSIEYDATTGAEVKRSTDRPKAKF